MWEQAGGSVDVLGKARLEAISSEDSEKKLLRHLDSEVRDACLGCRGSQ